MSIADKLTTVAENMPQVYEAGQKAEYDKFWEVFQDGDKIQNYYYAFAVGRFNDTTYNPKYPIRCSSGTTPGRNMFYNSQITDTKVAIYANNNNLYQAFNNATALKTIRLLNVYESTTFDATFTQCTSLKDITMDGVIGQSFDIRHSPLTTASIVSIIEHLSTTASGKALTLNTNAVNKMTFPYTSTQSGVTYNTWDELISIRSNWNISKVSA